MNFPFTTEQFLDVFATYNNSIWPFQVILSLLALTIVVLSIKRFNFSDKIILLILGFFWFWMGIVYHIMFFSRINPAAFIFGGLFVIQGFLFVWQAWKGNIAIQASLEWRKALGILLLLYALVIYPYIGMKMGHMFPAAPSFGAPCPTTIFTFGILLWSSKLPRHLLIIPALWSIIGFTAALKLGIIEDIGLLIAGIVATIILITLKPKRLAA